MTKSKAMKLYFKSAYNLDVGGSTPAQTLRDFLKQKFDYDANGNSVISLLADFAMNNASGSSNVVGSAIVNNAKVGGSE